MKTPFKPGPRDPHCSTCFTTMVQQKDIGKGWQWLCIRCDKRRDIPTNKYELGKDDAVRRK